MQKFTNKIKILALYLFSIPTWAEEQEHCNSKDCKIIEQIQEEVPQGTETPSQEPKTVTEEPKTVTEEPKTVTEEPKTVTEEPKTVTEEPKTVTEEPKNWYLGTSIELHSMLSIRGTYFISKYFELSTFASPSLSRSLHKSMKEHNFSGKKGFRLGTPPFTVAGKAYIGENYGLHLRFFPWERKNGFYIGTGVTSARMKMSAKANTAFLICNDTVKLPCSKQESTVYTFSEIAAEAKAIIQNRTLDLLIGKEVFRGEKSRIIFELGLGKVFWLNKDIHAKANFINSRYEDPGLEEDLEPYLRSQEDSLEDEIDEAISKNDIFIKYLPTFGIHVMF